MCSPEGTLFTLTNNNIIMQDNIIDRDELQDAYIERIIDGMDHKNLWQYVYDSLEQNFERYSVQELISEVEEYYPDLLED